jgi:hypothetical protein
MLIFGIASSHEYVFCLYSISIIGAFALYAQMGFSGR